MPPKPKHKKVKQTTPSVVVDTGRSATEMSKDELWDLALHLQEELDMIKKQRCDLVLEVDKVQTLWETTMKNLEEERDNLRSRRSEMDRAMERRRVEVTVYQQKLRHVLSEQSSTITEMKVDSASSSSLLQHQPTELELHKQAHVLQADCRDKQRQQETLIKGLLLKHHTEMMKMERDYEAKVHASAAAAAEELEAYQQREARMEEEQMKLQEASGHTDRTMESQMASLIEEQHIEMEKAQKEVDIAHRKLQSIKKKKTLIQETKDRLRQEEKDLNLERSENKRLLEKRSELEQEWDELQRKAQQYKNNKDVMTRYRRQLKVVSREHTDLSVQLELLRQAVQEVEGERDELQRKQTEDILDVQQKSGLKSMILKEKIAVVTEMLEKNQAQLYAALAICSSDPETRSNNNNNLKELMESKEKRITALQEEIAQRSEEYNKLLHDSEESWKASSNLLLNCPFKEPGAPPAAPSCPLQHPAAPSSIQQHPAAPSSPLQPPAASSSPQLPPAASSSPQLPPAASCSSTSAEATEPGL